MTASELGEFECLSNEDRITFCEHINVEVIGNLLQVAKKVLERVHILDLVLVVVPDMEDEVVQGFIMAG